MMRMLTDTTVTTGAGGTTVAMRNLSAFAGEEPELTGRAS
jgi:hypothetical protein